MTDTDLEELRIRVEALETRREVEAERINIVEPDGRLRLVISGADRAPDPVCNGQTLKRGGGNEAGIIFYNDEGDECGGLVFGGKKEGDEYSAGGALLFDQYKQDQVLGMMHEDANGRRRAGLWVWDRGDEPIPAVAGARRLFVGKTHDRAAVIELHDVDGLVRLRIAVRPDGDPVIEFLNQSGEVTSRLPGGESD